VTRASSRRPSVVTGGVRFPTWSWWVALVGVYPSPPEGQPSTAAGAAQAPPSSTVCIIWSRILLFAS
jgi:hypothetical protein